MASISSSKRNRKKDARDSDADLAPNTIRLVGQFRSQIYANLGELPVGSFEIFVDCLSSPEVGEFFDLDAETLSVPDDVTVTRGPIPTFKYQLFHNRRDMLAEGYVTLDPDDVVLDLNRARTATESEIRDALDYEPPAPPKVVPAEPVYRRVDRQPGDSFLGFTAGGGNENIKLTARWTICGFHLPSPQVIGRLKVSLNFRAMENDRLTVRIYDAAGECVFHTEMPQPEARFDHVRLPAGDYALGVMASNALTGAGSYRCPNSRVVSVLPTQPTVDRLLWPPQSEIDQTPGIRCAVPCFEFTSR